MSGPFPRSCGMLCLLAVLLAGWCAGCAPPRPPSYPGELLPPDALGPDFLAQQHLTFVGGGHRAELPVVLQKRGGELLMLGLTPFGTRAFAITLRDGRVGFEPYVDRPPPLEPRWVLMDVQRALRPPLTRPRPSGKARVRVGEERVTERWEGGRLIERWYRRVDGEPSGTIRIRYEPAWRKGGPAARISYENGWVGYRLCIRTDAVQPI